MSFEYSSQGTLREFGENTKNQGKLREFGENTNNQGKLREFVTVTQKGKGFASLVYMADSH